MTASKSPIRLGAELALLEKLKYKEASDVEGAMIAITITHPDGGASLSFAPGERKFVSCCLILFIADHLGAHEEFVVTQVVIDIVETFFTAEAIEEARENIETTHPTIRALLQEGSTVTIRRK